MQAYNSVMCGYFCIRFIDFMLKGKSLTDFSNLFQSFLMISKKTKKKKKDMIFEYHHLNDDILKMVECNSPNIYPNLSDQQQFRLNKKK